MSYIADFKGATFSLFGVNGGNTSTDLSCTTQVGQKFLLADGRTVVLVQNGGTALPSGVLVQSPASIGANHTGLTLSTAAIGATQITATLGGTAVTANQYAGGFLAISAGTGIGQLLRIASHPAAALSTTVVLTLEDPLSVATATATSKGSLTLPQYGGNDGTNASTFGVIISPTTATGKIVGCTLYPIPATTTTGGVNNLGVPSYGFIVTNGAVACLNDSVTAIGLDIMPSSAVAGAVVTYVAATRNRIGTSVVAGENTKAQLIEIQL